MPKAIVIHEHGGPDVLKWEDVTVGEPGEGEVLISHTAIGVNFIDVYIRTGLYPHITPPGTLGLEGAGTVQAIGPGVTGLSVGQRVAYSGGPVGAYAEQRVMPAAVLVPLPDSVSDRDAAALMLKGMTAEYLLFRTFPVQPGQTILVQAAAGGAGQLLCSWAKHIGATVIGTVGSADKAELARQHGCDHPILYREESVADRVAEITGGEGVPVVYDGVGQATFEGSLASLALRGHLVSFGQSSGTIEAFSIARLGTKSLTVTRPTLGHYARTRDELLEISGHVFKALSENAITSNVSQTYALKDAAQAHRDLEGRATTGASLLIP